MESLRNVYQHEVGNPEKRSKNLRFLRNCALFVAAVVLIRKYGDLLLPPPAEELAKYIQEQTAQQMQMMAQAPQ